MAVRKGLLGLSAGLALAGTAAGEPPVAPLVEGREPNPVVREYYGAEPPTFGYGSGAATEDLPGGSLPGAGWWTANIVWDVILDHLTVPLGTVPMSPRDGKPADRVDA